jgi:hypothetical protein
MCGVADEGDWYAALVAGEHVGDWLDVVKVRRFPPPRPKVRGFFFVFLLRDQVRTYEARRADVRGGVSRCQLGDMDHTGAIIINCAVFFLLVEHTVTTGRRTTCF